jgi:hypothetical protein
MDPLGYFFPLLLEDDVVVAPGFEAVPDLFDAPPLDVGGTLMI